MAEFFKHVVKDVELIKKEMKTLKSTQKRMYFFLEKQLKLEQIMLKRISALEEKERKWKIFGRKTI